MVGTAGDIPASLLQTILLDQVRQFVDQGYDGEPPILQGAGTAHPEAAVFVIASSKPAAARSATTSQDRMSVSVRAGVGRGRIGWSGRNRSSSQEDGS